MGPSFPWAFLGPAAFILLDTVILLVLIICVFLLFSRSTLSGDRNVQISQINTAAFINVNRTDSVLCRKRRRRATKSVKPPPSPCRTGLVILPARKVHARRYASKRRPIRKITLSTRRSRSHSHTALPSTRVFRERQQSIPLTIKQKVPCQPAESKSAHTAVVTIYSGASHTKAEPVTVTPCCGKSSLADDLLSILTCKSSWGLSSLPAFHPDDWVKQLRDSFPPIVVYSAMFKNPADFIMKGVSSAPNQVPQRIHTPRPLSTQYRNQDDLDDDDFDNRDRRQAARSLLRLSTTSAFEGIEDKDPERVISLQVDDATAEIRQRMRYGVSGLSEQQTRVAPTQQHPPQSPPPTPLAPPIIHSPEPMHIQRESSLLQQQQQHEQQLGGERPLELQQSRRHHDLMPSESQLSDQQEQLPPQSESEPQQLSSKQKGKQPMAPPAQAWGSEQQQQSPQSQASESDHQPAMPQSQSPDSSGQQGQQPQSLRRQQLLPPQSEAFRKQRNQSSSTSFSSSSSSQQQRSLSSSSSFASSPSPSQQQQPSSSSSSSQQQQRRDRNAQLQPSQVIQHHQKNQAQHHMQQQGQKEERTQQEQQGQPEPGQQPQELKHQSPVPFFQPAQPIMGSGQKVTGSYWAKMEEQRLNQERASKAEQMRLGQDSPGDNVWTQNGTGSWDPTQVKSWDRRSFAGEQPAVEFPVDEEDSMESEEQNSQELPDSDDMEDLVDVGVVHECEMADPDTDDMVVVNDEDQDMVSIAPAPVQSALPTIPTNFPAPPPPPAAQNFSLPPAQMDSFFQSFVPRKQQQQQQPSTSHRYGRYGNQTNILAPHLQPSEPIQLEQLNTVIPDGPASTVPAQLQQLNTVIPVALQEEREARELYDQGVHIFANLFVSIPHELVQQYATPLAREAMVIFRSTGARGEDLKEYLKSGITKLVFDKYPGLVSQCKLRFPPVSAPVLQPVVVATPAPAPSYFIAPGSAAFPAPQVTIKLTPTPEEPSTPAVKPIPKTPPPSEKASKFLEAPFNAGQNHTSTDRELDEREHARWRGDALSSRAPTFPDSVATARGADHGYDFSLGHGASPGGPLRTHRIRLFRNRSLKARMPEATACPSPVTPNVSVCRTMPAPKSRIRVVTEGKDDRRLHSADEAKAEIGVKFTAKGSEDRADQKKDQDAALPPPRRSLSPLPIVSVAAADSGKPTVDDEFSDQDAEGELEEDSVEIPLQRTDTVLGKRRRRDQEDDKDEAAPCERPAKRRRLNTDIEDNDRTSVIEASAPDVQPSSKPAAKHRRQKKFVTTSTSDTTKPRDRSQSRSSSRSKGEAKERRHSSTSKGDRRSSSASSTPASDARRKGDKVTVIAKSTHSATATTSSKSLGKRRREAEDEFDTPQIVSSKRARVISPPPHEIAAALRQGFHCPDESDAVEEAPRYTVSKRARQSRSPSFCPRGTFRAPFPSPPPVYRRPTSPPSPLKSILRRSKYSRRERLVGWIAASLGRLVFRRPRDSEPPTRKPTFNRYTEVFLHRRNSHIYEFERSQELLVERDSRGSYGM